MCTMRPRSWATRQISRSGCRRWAEHNSLVISDETRRLLRADFPLRPLGSRPLKGLSRRIEAFQVVGAPVEDDIAGGVRRRNAAPLVGRTAEIEQLLQEWELAKSGRGRTVEITGEPGIGKSRLAFELIGKTGLRDDSILVLQASAQHQNTPLYPIIRRLEQRIGIRKDESLEANAARLRDFVAAMPSADEQQYPVIARLLGLPIPASAATQTVPDAQDLRRRTRDIVVQVLTHSRATAAPGLILMEDFHWADPSTVEIVERIADRIAQRTDPARGRQPDRDSRATARLRSDASRFSGLPTATAAQIAAVGGAGKAAAAASCSSRSSPAPTACRCSWKSWRRRPSRPATSKPAPADVGGGHGVPSALYDSLMLRLERLGEARAIAQLGSVIGRSFLAPAAGGGDCDRAAQYACTLFGAAARVRLDQARGRRRRKGLFLQACPGAGRGLPIAPQAAAGASCTVASPTRSKSTGRRSPSREPDYLAQHLSEAGRTTRAAHMWIEAAKQSAARSANLEAVAQLRRALEEIKTAPGRNWTGQSGAGRAHRVDRTDYRAKRICGRRGRRRQRPGDRALPRAGRRSAHLSGDVRPMVVPAGRRQCARGQRAGAGLSDARRTEGHQDRSHGRPSASRHVASRRRDTAKAREHLELATKLYDAAADRMTAGIYGTEVQVTSLSNLCIVNWLLGRVSEAVAQGQEALELARQLGHAHTLGYAFAHVCSLHTLERDATTVKIMAQRALAGAIERELPLWISIARAYLGWSDVEAGQPGGRYRQARGAERFPAHGAASLLAADISVLAG